nr:MAG TPA: hypothetical protein [Caudoviricetes sp.]
MIFGRINDVISFLFVPLPILTQMRNVYCLS